MKELDKAFFELKKQELREATNDVVSRLKKRQMTLPELIKQLGKYGSGMTIERERDYHNNQNYYHVRMFGLIYPDEYEVVDTSLTKALRKVYKDSKEFSKYEL
jgi:hypothetical protein